MPSGGARFPRQSSVVVMQIPPRGSKYLQPDDPRLNIPTKGFEDRSKYASYLYRTTFTAYCITTSRRLDVSTLGTSRASIRAP